MSTCIRLECTTAPEPNRPWCGEHEPLTPEEIVGYDQRKARREAAAAAWGLSGRLNTCHCGMRAEPDKDTCEAHPNRCEGQKASTGRCTSRESVDGYCRVHHPKRAQLDKPIDMADPVACYECGRPTRNADATCWPCRTAAL